MPFLRILRIARLVLKLRKAGIYLKGYRDGRKARNRK